MKLDNLMLTKQKFSKLVEAAIIENKNMSYLDAVIMVCEKNEIEIEDSKKFISNAIKSKIESEATKLNMMQEKNRSVELE